MKMINLKISAISVEGLRKIQDILSSEIKDVRGMTKNFPHMNSFKEDLAELEHELDRLTRFLDGD